jgi:hypothetical protein
MVMVQNGIGQRFSLERPGGKLMPYKHGRPVIDLSFPFRLACAITFYLAFPIAMLINYMQHLLKPMMAFTVTHYFPNNGIHF